MGERGILLLFLLSFTVLLLITYINSVRLSILEEKGVAKREHLYSVVVCWLFKVYVNRTSSRCVFLKNKWLECVLVVVYCP